jgi:hypothetical protein
MKQPMRRAMLAAVLGLMAATAGRARAEMIVNFSYSGRGGPDNAGLIATGAGSFSFADDLSTVGLVDLTSFDFTLDENTPNTATFRLADLTSISASVGPGPTLTSLALATGPVQGSNPETWPREFAISSLGPGASATYFHILGQSLSLTAETVTITSIVPEPSAFALAVLGALVVAGGWSRRRKARAPA